MKKYAVVKISGKQYKVSEGDKVLVDKLASDGELLTLLYHDENKTLIGKPYLSNVKLTYKKEDTVKGEKIDVFKYKSKSRSRRHVGFRAQYTPVIIEKISA